eukprot:TRINITY_DN38355_c0_g1_i1.p2 TRINITY_DN38355_c0_g1~~TRINITY_DN38355_c0_g1_i1.p2  ORF type:complete len:152 (+),score=49.00 TRINITY_DN38355_c0_g1_i1:118-573(+)
MARARAICFLLVVFALVLEASVSKAQEVGDMPDFNKMRTKEVKKFLDERGVECAGCVEKEHFVEAAKGAFALPLLSEDELKARADAKSGKSTASTSEEKKGGTYQDKETEKKNKEDIAKLMNELKKGGKGFENMKMFTPDDLKNFDFKEDL